MAAGDDGVGGRFLRCRRRRLARRVCSSTARTGRRAGASRFSALYRNNSNGTFTNVTAGSGLDVEMYGIGVAVADYDNDGREDVYITALEGDRLFHNEGDGKFSDVTKAAGISNANFGTSAAWLDYDNDGKVDLFVANYVQWTRRATCGARSTARRNRTARRNPTKARSRSCITTWAAGEFEDVSAEGRARRSDQQVARRDRFRLTTATAGRTSSSPTTRSRTSCIKQQRQRHVHRSRHGGGRGVRRGRRGARSDGRRFRRLRPFGAPAPAGGQLLQPDARPLSQRGHRAVRGRSAALDGRAAPACSAWRSASSSSTTTSTACSTSSAANGHIEEEIGRVQPKVQYKQPPLLFRNPGKRKFEDVTTTMGAGVQPPHRGARRGLRRLRPRRRSRPADHHQPRAGVPVPQRRRQPRITGSASARWGRSRNRDGIGAVVGCESASGKQWHMVRSGSSYCSQSDLAVTFGLGKDPQVQGLDIQWPSGTKTASHRTGGEPVLHHRRRQGDRGEIRRGQISRASVSRPKPLGRPAFRRSACGFDRSGRARAAPSAVTTAGRG